MGSAQVASWSRISVPAATIECGRIALGKRFNNKAALLCRPSQKDASVAHVNNDHPAHFGVTFLVIIDMTMAKSLLFPSSEETAILQHLPKIRPWPRIMWKFSKSGSSSSPSFRLTILQHPTKLNLSETAKIQDGEEEPLWRIVCVDPPAAAQCGSVWPRPSPLYLALPPTTTHTPDFWLHSILLLNNSHVFHRDTILTKNSEI